MKVFSIIVLVLMFLVLVFLAVYLLVARILFHICFGRKNVVKRLEEKAGLIKDYKIDVCWWDKYKFDELSLISNDGYKLKGHYLDRKSDYTAILVHGYGCDYKEMSGYAKMFVDMGYNVLAIENKAHGKSEGNMIGMGWLDRLDILAWINLLVEKNEKIKIVLFGLSMGGSGVCMTLGQKLPKNVICAISDCAYANVYSQISHVFNPKNKKFRALILKMFSSYMDRAYQFNFKKADAKEELKKSDVPILFIHGKDDTFVPIENLYELASVVPSQKKDIFIVSDAGHAMSYVVSPRRYELRVREFLKKWGG